MTMAEYLTQCKANREHSIARRPFQPRVRDFADESWREGLKELSHEDRESN